MQVSRGEVTQKGQVAGYMGVQSGATRQSRPCRMGEGRQVLEVFQSPAAGLVV